MFHLIQPDSSYTTLTTFARNRVNIKTLTLQFSLSYNNWNKRPLLQAYFCSHNMNTSCTPCITRYYNTEHEFIIAFTTLILLYLHNLLIENKYIRNIYYIFQCALLVIHFVMLKSFSYSFFCQESKIFCASKKRYMQAIFKIRLRMLMRESR